MNNYPVILLSDVVIFPKMVFSILIEMEVSVKCVDYAIENNVDVILATKQISENKENSINNSVYPTYAVTAKILQVLRMPNGSVKILFEAQDRIKLLSVSFKENEIPVADTETVDISYDDNPKLEALKRKIIDTICEYAELSGNVKQNIIEELNNMSDLSNLADIIFNNLALSTDEKQKMLSTIDVPTRLNLAVQFIQREIDIFKTEKNIQNDVQEQINKNNREYYLKEQLKFIQKELGNSSEEIDQRDIKEFERKGKLKKFSKEAREKFDNELRKLKLMSPMSSEASVSRTYIEWLLDLPWKEKSPVTKDLKRARAILDRDHFGLEKVKERILEYLAVQNRIHNVKGQILCLFGPPGVGKTSLAKSIAEATGRNYIKISLGGVRDEAEIRGHRRTYISALPGKIISALKKAKSSNPLILLDEIDKMGSDSRGDPESALLEVLDPEQNKSFNDHYLEIDYDLSDVMFIATANTLEMSRPLIDRLEIIKLSGYTEFEKFEIAKKYLIPKINLENGLNEGEFNVDESAIWKLIRDYTRESGVRNLYRELSNLARKAVKEISENDDIKSVTITAENLFEYAGIQKYLRDPIEEKSLVGITTGLAWTEVGGETLSIEAAMFPGKGKITLTGKLGNVMQESIQAAMSLIRSRAEKFDIDQEVFEKNDFHIHVPDGATPKDGPSAGIAMVTSIVSAISGKPVRKDVAMTGEITLRGRVLPIGGLKEKILAAHRAFIKVVIVPKDNEKDLKDIPANVIGDIDIRLVTSIDEVLDIALVK